jgi:ferrous iron transport protein B
MSSPQCASTLSVVRRVTNSWKWTAFLFRYMALAYSAVFVTYQASAALGAA